MQPSRFAATADRLRRVAGWRRFHGGGSCKGEPFEWVGGWGPLSEGGVGRGSRVGAARPEPRAGSRAGGAPSLRRLTAGPPTEKRPLRERAGHAAEAAWV